MAVLIRCSKCGCIEFDYFSNRDWVSDEKSSIVWCVSCGNYKDGADFNKAKENYRKANKNNN